MDEQNTNYITTVDNSQTISLTGSHTLSGYFSFYPEFVNIPERSDWHCEMFGGDGIVWNPRKGQEPNFFWRWMQYICFGNKWYKK